VGNILSNLLAVCEGGQNLEPLRLPAVFKVQQIPLRGHAGTLRRTTDAYRINPTAPHYACSKCGKIEIQETHIPSDGLQVRFPETMFAIQTCKCTILDAEHSQALIKTINYLPSLPLHVLNCGRQSKYHQSKAFVNNSIAAVRS
jgi:hypothetical protein